MHIFRGKIEERRKALNVGIVTTWFERGGAIVSRAYRDLLSKQFRVFIYARGGERYGQKEEGWNGSEVTWGKSLFGTNIDAYHLARWIERNQIDVLFFNEQHQILPVLFVRKRFPRVKLGCYVDFYTESTVPDFEFYDFLLCNTKRHYSVFSSHPQCFYVPWGTDVELFRPSQPVPSRMPTFFHSMGMSLRKGTGLLLETFFRGDLPRESRLIIHSQVDFFRYFDYSREFLSQRNVEVIHKTVPAPGLYHMGDVYVYPTTLDGLGLTVFEALACGLPVICTDEAPMNEIVRSDFGRLVEVARRFSRYDGFYWPKALGDNDSLEEAMWFYIRNPSTLEKQKRNAREFALQNLDWKQAGEQVCSLFSEVSVRDVPLGQIERRIRKEKEELRKRASLAFLNLLPPWLQGFFGNLYRRGRT